MLHGRHDRKSSAATQKRYHGNPKRSGSIRQNKWKRPALADQDRLALSIV
jgi:hypothetical protein